MNQDFFRQSFPSHIEGSSQEEIDAYFQMMSPLVRGIAATFGRTCEVVLHDFRHPEHSIVEIAGEVTNRHIGGSMSQIGLEILAQGDAAQDKLNYLIRTSDGQFIKSSTILLRDPHGHIFGALCINLDVTELRFLAHLMGELAGMSSEQPTAITFGDDVGQIIQAVLREQEIALGHPLTHLTRKERLALFQELDQRGIFTLQRAVPQVAEQLGISRATIYSDLAVAREENLRRSLSNEPTSADTHLKKGRGAKERENDISTSM